MNPQERKWVEVEPVGAVAERAFELKAHQVVGHQPQVLLGNGWAKNVPAESFTADGIVRSDRGRGMQREALRGGAEPFGLPVQ